MRPVLRWVAIASAVGMVASCGRGRGGGQAEGDDGGEGVEGGLDEGAAEAGNDGPAVESSIPEGGLVGDGATTDCAVGADLVYVVSEERVLYSFDPGKNLVNPVGSVDCASGVYANSMAVARNGDAYINFGDGSLWRTSTATGGCFPTGYVAGQKGVGLFGMGFSAKAAGSSAEQLFIDDLGINGNPGNGLGYIDLSTMTLQLFGPLAGSLAGRSAELTGTGDARLFGFFEGSPFDDAGSAAVVQIDPNSEGAVTTYTLPTVDTGSDWAFSFWGGDFFLYTADKYNANMPFTVITRFRPSDGSVTVVDPDLGFRIVGAGSSTCAPLTSTQ
jgi:hypothetical protein